MGETFVLLTKDEIESLADFIKINIFTITKYYATDGQKELGREELTDTKNKIDEWWDFYDQIFHKEYIVLRDYEFIRKLEIDLSFDIFSVLYENVWDVDNTFWLYNVLSVWKKCDEFVKQHDQHKDCCGC